MQPTGDRGGTGGSGEAQFAPHSCGGCGGARILVKDVGDGSTFASCSVISQIDLCSDESD